VAANFTSLLLSFSSTAEKFEWEQNLVWPIHVKPRETGPGKCSLILYIADLCVSKQSREFMNSKYVQNVVVLYCAIKPKCTMKLFRNQRNDEYHCLQRVHLINYTL